MRITELEICNIRGVKQLKLSPNGKNMVIWGPNGSGKSAVVDAVDFLLTGRISRLIGEGTAGISLKAHGPHIDHLPKDALVKAKILIPGHQGPIPLERSMSSPTALICSAEHKELIGPMLQLASLGQHVLSRREILRYVAAEAGKRAGEVQALLNLSDLEEIRKSFGRVSNNAKSELTAAETAIKSARSTIQFTLSLTTFDFEATLKSVNGLRAILAGQPLTKLYSENLKAGIVAPATESKSTNINPQALAKNMAEITNNLANLETNIRNPDKELGRSLDELRANEAVLSEISKLKLMQLGISQIPEDGSCPLCGSTWEPGRLRERLESHILHAKAASEKLTKIQELAWGMSNIASNVRSHILQINYAADHLKMTKESSALGKWSACLSRFVETLTDPLAKYPRETKQASEVAKLFAPDGFETLLEKVLTEAQLKIPPISPEQTAWDTLTSLRENWKQYEKAEARLDNARLYRDRSKVLEDSFEAARDQALSTLYSTIESRFSALYKLIHEDDEPKFESTIRPSGAGLAFEVDFYGRGKFPPLALHSEGHQDTMGLCLYLVLAERLTQNIIELTILDDVVMSIDAGHRRKVCDLLASQFSNRQFLITTHDRTWARQLITTGVVPRANSVEFTRWSLETGPLVATEVIDIVFWKQITEEIEKGDIPSAAGRLRRGAEEYFEQVCDKLRATVRYRTDGRWEFSDFVSAAIGAYRRFLKEAKAAANSWGNAETVTRLQELESIANQIIQRSQLEQWGINENVHYNRWGEFQPEDFRPISEAWRDLLGLFRCSSCDGVLFLSIEGQNPSSLRCKCGQVSWNLLKKTQSEPTGSA